MSEEIVYLKVPDRSPVKRPQPDLFPGRNYSVISKGPLDQIHGLCANYSVSKESANVEDQKAHDTRAFLWDLTHETDSEIQLHNGESAILLNANTPLGGACLVVSDATLSVPKILDEQDGRLLEFRIEIEGIFSSEIVSSRFGIVNLLSASRFVAMENGEQSVLFSTLDEEPVLFIDDNSRSSPIDYILETNADEEPVRHLVTRRICHRIPEHVGGIKTQSMTVLEQYHSYFMQRELPLSDNTIWTPVCAPITWGWSIRLERRQDDEWTITRQKLLNPAIGNEGLEMPVWKKTSRE